MDGHAVQGETRCHVLARDFVEKHGLGTSHTRQMLASFYSIEAILYLTTLGKQKELSRSHSRRTTPYLGLYFQKCTSLFFFFFLFD